VSRDKSLYIKYERNRTTHGQVIDYSVIFLALFSPHGKIRGGVDKTSQS